VAERLGRGLQSLVQRFESARRLFRFGFGPGFPRVESQVRLLLRTSQGSFVVSINCLFGPVTLTFHRFADSGWADARAVWSFKHGALTGPEAATLRTFLRERFAFPEQEQRSLRIGLKGLCSSNGGLAEARRRKSNSGALARAPCWFLARRSP
jgi:hypothetical protein